MRKTILRGLAVFLLFLLLLHLTVSWLGLAFFHQLQRTSTAIEQPFDYSTYYFGRAPRDHYDTVFIGSSHQYCSVDANLLNREYGAHSILLTSSMQNLKLSFFAVLEAIELQHPRTVVLEMMQAVNETDDAIPYSKIAFLSNMPNWSRTKAAAVKAMGDPPYEYYYPLTLLHSNWPNLIPEDFILPPRLPAGMCYHNYIDRVFPLEKTALLSPEEKAPMPEPSRYWMDQILALCRENDIRLILYTAPWLAPEEDQAVYNGIADYAREHDLAYYNLIPCMEEIGIDPACDFGDKEHLNLQGQEKVTRWLAEHVLFS